MCWVDHDRQLRFRLQEWDGAQIEGIPGHRFKSADAPFAEEDVWVSLAQNIFGAQEQIVDRGAKAALEHHWEMAAAHFFEECKILHVPRANLKAIGVLLHQGKVTRV